MLGGFEPGRSPGLHVAPQALVEPNLHDEQLVGGCRVKCVPPAPRPAGCRVRYPAGRAGWAARGRTFVPLPGFGLFPPNVFQGRVGEQGAINTKIEHRPNPPKQSPPLSQPAPPQPRLLRPVKGLIPGPASGAGARRCHPDRLRWSASQGSSVRLCVGDCRFAFMPPPPGIVLRVPGAGP